MAPQPSLQLRQTARPLEVHVTHLRQREPKLPEAAEAVICDALQRIPADLLIYAVPCDWPSEPKINPHYLVPNGAENEESSLLSGTILAEYREGRAAMRGSTLSYSRYSDALLASSSWQKSDHARVWAASDSPA